MRTFTRSRLPLITIAVGIAIAASLVLAVGGCGDDSTGPEQREEIALFGYLYVGETIADSNAVYLTRTTDITHVYDRTDAAIVDATVLVRNDSSGIVDTLWMVGPGLYANPAVTILPRTPYSLSAELPDGRTITASTTTPEAIEILTEPRELPGEMHHASIPDSFPITLRCPDPEQILMVDIYCLENWEDALWIHPFGNDDTPTDYTQYGGDNGEPRHIFAYFRAKDITHDADIYTVSFYGDMMWFYGNQQVGVFSIDTNYYNYVYKDHPELNGGVTGGIGVFGSACRRQYLVRAVE